MLNKLRAWLVFWLSRGLERRVVYRYVPKPDVKVLVSMLRSTQFEWILDQARKVIENKILKSINEKDRNERALELMGLATVEFIRDKTLKEWNSKKDIDVENAETLQNVEQYEKVFGEIQFEDA
jgi:hypothetical protein